MSMSVIVLSSSPKGLEAHRSIIEQVLRTPLAETKEWGELVFGCQVCYSDEQCFHLDLYDNDLSDAPMLELSKYAIAVSITAAYGDEQALPYADRLARAISLELACETIVVEEFARLKMRYPNGMPAMPPTGDL
jgi:hypothetical protein